MENYENPANVIMENTNNNNNTSSDNTMYYISLSILFILLVISCMFCITDGFNISCSLSSSCVIIMILVIYFNFMQPDTKNKITQQFQRGREYMNQQYQNYMPNYMNYMPNHMNYPQPDYNVDMDNQYNGHQFTGHQ